MASQQAFSFEWSQGASSSDSKKKFGCSREGKFSVSVGDVAEAEGSCCSDEEADQVLEPRLSTVTEEAPYTVAAGRPGRSKLEDEDCRFGGLLGNVRSSSTISTIPPGFKTLRASYKGG
jgi:hypothetical protein